MTSTEAPLGWTVLERRPDGFSAKSKDNLFVICGFEVHDGKDWVHVSISRRSRLPSWDDLKRVKNQFIGEDKEAIQVLPPKDEYVNIHPHVLHLWHCRNQRQTPVMSGFIGGMRSI